MQVKYELDLVYKKV